MLYRNKNTVTLMNLKNLVLKKEARHSNIFLYYSTYTEIKTDKINLYT